jgi:hypothetical protein
MALGDTAYVKYGQALTKGTLTAIPRNKFSFTVKLIIAGGGVVDLTRIANVQLPTFTYRTQTLNNYNSKSIVQTGIDYTPITLTAYDTKDAEFEKFLKDYANHYITGPMNQADYEEWKINSSVKNSFGLKTPDDNHYITSMIITRVDATVGDTVTHSNVTEIFHPFIQNIDADTLDYSDSAPSTYRITFGYEGFRILSEAMNIPVGLAPPSILNPTTIQPEVNTFVDQSAIHTTRHPEIKSNKPEIQPVLETNNQAVVTSTTTSSFRGTVQGVWGNMSERLARANEIVAGGQLAGDTEFAPGKNQIVTKDGVRYIAQVPESEIHYTDTDPDTLGEF